MIDHGRESAGRGAEDPGRGSEGMAFVFSMALSSDVAVSVFLMALKRDEAREDDVEE